MYVLVLTTTIQALVSMAALTLPVLAPKMAQDLGLTSTIAGYYIALLYLAAMPIALLGGDAVVRFGPIRVNQAGLISTAAGLALICTGNLEMCLLGTILLGLGYGPITPASSHMLALSTPQKNMSLVFSIKQTGVPLGGVLAGLVAPQLESLIGWRGTFLLISVMCVACAAWAEKLRQQHDYYRNPNHAIGLALVKDLGQLLRISPTLRSLAIASMCFSTFQLTISTYLVTYLHEDFGYSLLSAGAAMSLAQAAGVVGRIVWGVTADRLIGSIGMLVTLACAMSLSAIFLSFSSAGTPTTQMMILVCIAGACGLGWNGALLAEVTRKAPQGFAGRATGLILSFTFTGVLFGPPLFGFIALQASSYKTAFLIVAIGPAIAALLLFRQRKKF